MGLYAQWREITQAEGSQSGSNNFWNEYFAMEKLAYEQILENRLDKFEGRLDELAAKFSMEPSIFVGFLDGINTSLTKELDLESLNEDTVLSSKIDYKKLYWNMHEAKADWLYNLEQWDGILSSESRDEITKEFRLSKMAVSTKVGRNDPCPCGSGKKYKKCCGK